MMDVGQYISLGVAIFNILLGLIAFFGGIVVRGLSDSIKDLKANHDQFQKDLVHYVRKEDYKDDVSEIKKMIERLFDRIDTFAKK